MKKKKRTVYYSIPKKRNNTPSLVFVQMIVLVFYFDRVNVFFFSHPEIMKKRTQPTNTKISINKNIRDITGLTSNNELFPKNL